MDNQLQTYIMLSGVGGIKGKHFRTNKGLVVILVNGERLSYCLFHPLTGS